MRVVLSLACLALMGAVAHAQTPPDKSAVKVTGYRVTAEGGENGTVTYRYDDQGRPIGNAPRPTADGQPIPRPERPESSEEAPAGTAAEATAPGQPTVMRTADGRPLPFQITGGNGVKTVDETVDADAALRKLTRPSDLLDRRFEAGQIDLARDERFATSGNAVSLGRWQGKASLLGTRRSDIELADTLGAEVRPRHMVEVKAVERPTSPWSSRLARPAGWDERVGGASDLGGRRVNRDEISTMGTRANAFPRNPAGLEQLSMQDINRYQFRRARSTEPGLPVAKPGSDEVRTR